MKTVFQEIVECVAEFLDEFFWDWRGLPYSYDHHKIMSHPEDRKLYLEALKRLRSGSEKETFILHTGDTVTIF